MADPLVNLYDLRTLAGVVSKMPKDKTFLRDNFFSNTQTFSTKEIDFDVLDDEVQKLAPFVNPKSQGSFSYRDGFSTHSYQPGTLAPMIVTSADEMLSRLPGENLYSTHSPLTRARTIMANNLAYLERQISRREEYMAAEVLFTGKITFKGEGVNDTLTMWNAEDKPYTDVAVKWTETTADPISDLRAAIDKVGEKIGMTPTMAILGQKAAKVLMDRLTEKGTLDQRRINIGTIQPSAELSDGSQYIGTLLYPNLELYTYNGVYFNEDLKKTVYFVPEDSVLLVCKGAPTTRAYAAVDIIDGNNRPLWVEGARVANSWVQRTDPAGRVVQMKSRPLMICHMPHCFHVLKVIGD